MARTVRFVVALVIVAAALGAAAPALACPTCWGASDSPMAAGMNNGIFVLLGVIGTVQVGFAALFVSFRRRSRVYQERKESFEVIKGGAR